MVQLKELKENQYKVFIGYALKTCNSFSLVFEKQDSNKESYIHQEFFDCIKEDLISKKGIYIHPDTGTHFQDSEIVYFNCNHQLAQFFKANNIFDWNGVYLPEELCFYRNGKKWLTIVSHEREILVFDTSKSDIDFFEQNCIKYWFGI